MKYTKELHDRVRQNLRMFDYPRFDDGDIDALLDEIDRLQSESRWRKYPDEKPEFGERVLVYMKNNYVVIASMFTDNYESSNFWKNDSGQEISNVILWRPLPQPPEEQE